VGREAVSEATRAGAGGSDPLTLQGKVAVLTGGSGGIGRGIAAALDARGVRVVVAGRDAVRVAETTATLRHGAGFPDCDVRDAARVEALFAFATERLGDVDIAIACAGTGRPKVPGRFLPEPVASLDEREWSTALDTNLRGVFHVARSAARRMVPRRAGQIVNISSARGGLMGLPFGAPYCASKMAARAMFQAFAAEMAPSGVRVFSLLPDAVDTGLIAGTRLAAAGALTPRQVGEVVADLLAMPADAVLEEVRLSSRDARRSARAPEKETAS
jgi:NAD(P)-dependent dehydrogenase (short-subunit alcohol dehydrogenase family)